VEIETSKLMVASPNPQPSLKGAWSGYVSH